LTNGVIFADFAPFVSIKEGKTTFKRALSIRANFGSIARTYTLAALALRGW